MSIIQLHHQFPDGHTEMKSQGDVEDYGDLERLIADTIPQFPLPKDATWLAVEESSKLFCLAERV